ncbi:hypothetical protein LOZ37_006352, partial [Ophidiomyces ophidiicola]
RRRRRSHFRKLLLLRRLPHHDRRAHLDRPQRHDPQLHGHRQHAGTQGLPEPLPGPPCRHRRGLLDRCRMHHLARRDSRKRRLHRPRRNRPLADPPVRLSGTEAELSV